MKASLFTYFALSLGLLLCQLCQAGRIGRFRFHPRELLQEGDTMESKAEEVETQQREENGLIGRVTFDSSDAQHRFFIVKSPSFFKLRVLFDVPDTNPNPNKFSFTHTNSSIPLNHGSAEPRSYWVHLRVRQKEPERVFSETSDYFFVNDTYKIPEAEMQKHVKITDCVDHGALEALSFSISSYAVHSSSWANGDLLEEECRDHSFKKRKLWGGSYPVGYEWAGQEQHAYSMPTSFVGEEMVLEHDCFDNNYRGQEHHRSLRATFVPNPVRREFSTTESNCIDTADERVVSFVPWNETQTFTEHYVKEDECVDDADATVAPVYAFNADARWSMAARRADAFNGGNATVVSLDASEVGNLPLYDRVTVDSAGALYSMHVDSHGFMVALGIHFGPSPAFPRITGGNPLFHWRFQRTDSTVRTWNSREPELTLMAWVKGVGTLLALFGTNSHLCGRRVVFSIDENRKPSLDFGCHDAHESRLHTTSEWTHIAYTYDGFGSRTIVIDGQQELDVYENTTRDYFNETQKQLSEPHTHNTVLLRYNELGDIVGPYAGYSGPDCLAAALSLDHAYFTVEAGVCQSSMGTIVGQGSVFRRSKQYRITAENFDRMERGPFTGQLDELFLFDRLLTKETIFQLSRTQNVGTRFDGASLVSQTRFGLGASKKVAWTRYEPFDEEHKERTECRDRADARYEAPLSNHPTYNYSAEGRGAATQLRYDPYNGALENVSHLAGALRCRDAALESVLRFHSYQNDTSLGECLLERNKDGACDEGGEFRASTEADCAGVFFPLTAYTWLPDAYNIRYDVKEEDCAQNTEVWGTAQPLLYGKQGRNVHVYNEHERDMYWLNKVGGTRQTANTTSLSSVQAWCRATISCAGIQQDGDTYYPVEQIEAPLDDTAYGYRECPDEATPKLGAMECFHNAAREIGPAGLVYVHGDEYRSHTWGYSGHTNGTLCFKDSDGAFFNWALDSERQQPKSRPRTVAECRTWATENGFGGYGGYGGGSSLGSMSCPTDGATHPVGCYEKSGVGAGVDKVYFNDCAEASSSTACGEPFAIQNFYSSPPASSQHLTESECQQRANGWDYTFNDQYDQSPAGCTYSEDEMEMYWNVDYSSTVSCSYSKTCVRKVGSTVCIDIETNAVSPPVLCSDNPNDYSTMPISQTRWQRDNDTVLSTKEKDCVDHRLQWLPHSHQYETRGTGSRPHFLVSGQKAWQREPVDCLYASNATFAIGKTTARACRDEAIFFGAIGYSFQRIGAEFIHMTARHYTHPEEARAECQRLQAHSDGPENAWDLCTNAQYNCAADDSCITSNTPDNTIFAVAACCFNTGTSCAITTNTSVCTPKRGYESFFFDQCADENIENATNTTYNVYAPEWNRSEWRAETHSRAYDAAYYDIVQESEPCDRGMHLSYDECQTAHITTFSSKAWLGAVYDRRKIAGCAVEGTDMYYNRYLYDSAKQPEAGDKAICQRHFEHFTSAFDYSSTACMYLNHELELSVSSQSACQDYGSAHGFKAISYSDQRCLLARARGPCEAKALWNSSFFVEAEVEGQFTRNTNLETSVMSISECLLNQTALFDFKQVPYGREEHGVLYDSALAIVLGFVEETTGTADLTFTATECQSFATEQSLPFSTTTCSSDGATHPFGCYKKNSNIYFNDCPQAASTPCGELVTFQRFSSGSGVQGVHLTKSECQQQHGQNMYDAVDEGYEDDYPAGCSYTSYWGHEYTWNSKSTSTYPCSSLEQCVRKIVIQTSCIHKSTKLASLEAAKVACDSQTNCTIVYSTPAGDFYALGEAMAQELPPTPHAQYTLHKHWVKNTNNYANRTHARHFHASSKEACHEACLADNNCMQIVFTEGYCFFYDDVYEALNSGALDSYAIYQEIKGAVAYGDTGDCWLYRNSIGRGKCTDFTNASNYSVYPLDVGLTGENKVVYVLEESDTLQATAYAPIVTEERTEEWCRNREGTVSWEAYGPVVRKGAEDACAGTWAKDADVERHDVLERQCDLLDSHKVSFTRNPDIVTDEALSVGYQKEYQNGYEMHFTRRCGSKGERVEYTVENETLYGTSGACYLEYPTSECQTEDLGHGYALEEGTCLVYQHAPGSNFSDCRYKHSAVATSHVPVEHLDLASAIDACNSGTECAGICEASDAQSRAFYLTKQVPSAAPALFECFPGWAGNNCSAVDATGHTDERVTDKRHTALSHCATLDQRLCSESELPAGASDHPCVHYGEQTNCSDHLAIAITYCCGKTALRAKFRRQAIFYERFTDIGTCAGDPVVVAGSLVYDSRPKLVDQPLVAPVARAVCAGSTQSGAADCQQGCVASPSCKFFSTTNDGRCFHSTTCDQFVLFGEGNAYEVKRRHGVYDAPQPRFGGILGECKYHYGVRAADVTAKTTFADAVGTTGRWRCERARISAQRDFDYSIHSFNQSFQFDVMRENSVTDTERMTYTLKDLAFTTISATSVQECIASAGESFVVSFKEATGECRVFADSWKFIQTTSLNLGQSFKAAGLYEGPFHLAVDLFENSHLVTHQPYVAVTDWLLSSAKDDCEILCDHHDGCEAYVLDGQDCHLHAMPDQTTIEYMRTFDAQGPILAYVKTEAEYVCRFNGAKWELPFEPVNTTHPLENTELLATTQTFARCKQAFLDDMRVPRLDTLLFNESTGECRVSLLRNLLVRAEGGNQTNGFAHYVLTAPEKAGLDDSPPAVFTESFPRDECFQFAQDNALEFNELHGKGRTIYAFIETNASNGITLLPREQCREYQETVHAEKAFLDQSTLPDTACEGDGDRIGGHVVSWDSSETTRNDFTLDFSGQSSDATTGGMTKTLCQQYASERGLSLYEYDNRFSGNYEPKWCNIGFHNGAYVYIVTWNTRTQRDAANNCGMYGHTCIHYTQVEGVERRFLYTPADSGLIPWKACQSYAFTERVVFSNISTADLPQGCVMHNGAVVFNTVAQSAVPCTAHGGCVGQNASKAFTVSSEFSYQTTGLPTFSLTFGECRSFGLSAGALARSASCTDGESCNSNKFQEIHSLDAPAGCYKVGNVPGPDVGGTVYYNNATSTVACDTEKQCIYHAVEFPLGFCDSECNGFPSYWIEINGKCHCTASARTCPKVDASGVTLVSNEDMVCSVDDTTVYFHTDDSLCSEERGCLKWVVDFHYWYYTTGNNVTYDSLPATGCFKDAFGVYFNNGTKNTTLCYTMMPQNAQGLLQCIGNVTLAQLETEDIERQQCFSEDSIRYGEFCTSLMCAPFFEREKDVIRHELLETECGAQLPPILPLLAYSWDRNQQPVVTLNIGKAECEASANYQSHRSSVAGRVRVRVNSQAECEALGTNAVYLGHEPLSEPEYRSSCNGVVDTNMYEKVFDHPIQMAAAAQTRRTVEVESLDDCALHARDYYSHYNRTDKTKVFEFKFETSQGTHNCAFFESVECAGLCLPETDPSSDRVGFSTFRLDLRLGVTAASCFLTSVLDSTATNRAYCRKCPIGKFNNRAGSNCLPCSQGRYADVPGLSSCKLCPKNSFAWGSGESHCHHCPSGQYSDDYGNKNCKICSAGKYEVNNVCVDCPPGRSNPENFEENDAGKLRYTGSLYRGALMYYDARVDYSSVHGFSNKNQLGEYMEGYSPIFTGLRNQQAKAHDDEDDCSVCPAGQYSDEAGAAECKACARGSYQPLNSSTACDSCPAGGVARSTTAKNAFHEFADVACSSAETLGEIRSATEPFAKTYDDAHLISSIEAGDLPACMDACMDSSACLFVSYDAPDCRLYRKCDLLDRSADSYRSYRRSKYTTSPRESTSFQEAAFDMAPYGPPYHTCEESALLIQPESYLYRPDTSMESFGTIAIATTIADALLQCNARADCVAFTYTGVEDVGERVFSESNPIELKGHGESYGAIGKQTYFKESPVDTLEDCALQCAALEQCSYVLWEGNQRCMKWETCSPQHDADGAHVQTFRVEQSSSFRLFNWNGTWPCDASVFTGTTRAECERHAAEKEAPMFYYYEGACHVYMTYTNVGVRELYSSDVQPSSTICTQGGAPVMFDFALPGEVRAMGQRYWDTASDACEACPRGLFTGSALQTVCERCPRGRFDKDDFKRPSCDKCPAGAYQDEQGQAKCKACAVGRFQSVTGASSCDPSGQGYETVGEGTLSAAEVSGPRQNNTHDDPFHALLGATGRTICGRNTFGPLYENERCLHVPAGAISVRRERTWTTRTGCLFDTSTAANTRNLSAEAVHYTGDAFDRHGLASMDECVALVNDQATTESFEVVAVSYGEGRCLLYSRVPETGGAPACLSNQAYQSATLAIAETAYGASSEDPASPDSWFKESTPYSGIEYVSPWGCSGIHYHPVGTGYTAEDCTSVCRQQKYLGEAACRYIAYDPEEATCWLVNWKPNADNSMSVNTGTGAGTETTPSNTHIIYESTIANIETPCSTGSKEFSFRANSNLGTDWAKVGTGGYRVKDFVAGASVGQVTQVDESHGESDTLLGSVLSDRVKKDYNGVLSSGSGGGVSSSPSTAAGRVIEEDNELYSITVEAENAAATLEEASYEYEVKLGPTLEATAHVVGTGKCFSTNVIVEDFRVGGQSAAYWRNLDCDWGSMCFRGCRDFRQGLHDYYSEDTNPNACFCQCGGLHPDECSDWRTNEGNWVTKKIIRKRFDYDMHPSFVIDLGRFDWLQSLTLYAGAVYKTSTLNVYSTYSRDELNHPHEENIDILDNLSLEYFDNNDNSYKTLWDGDYDGLKSKYQTRKPVGRPWSRLPNQCEVESNNWQVPSHVEISKDEFDPVQTQYVRVTMRKTDSLYLWYLKHKRFVANDPLPAMATKNNHGALDIYPDPTCPASCSSSQCGESSLGPWNSRISTSSPQEWPAQLLRWRVGLNGIMGSPNVCEVDTYPPLSGTIGDVPRGYPSLYPSAGYISESACQSLAGSAWERTIGGAIYVRDYGIPDAPWGCFRGSDDKIYYNEYDYVEDPPMPFPCNHGEASACIKDPQCAPSYWYREHPCTVEGGLPLYSWGSAYIPDQRPCYEQNMDYYKKTLPDVASKFRIGHIKASMGGENTASEWADCDGMDMTRDKFQAECKFNRRKFYNRVTAAVLQNENVAATAVPDWGVDYGYSGGNNNNNVLYIKGLYDFQDQSTAQKFHVRYKKQHHIGWSLERRPLYDVGLDPSKWVTIASDNQNFRAVLGANAWESCSDSSSTAYAPNMLLNCDQLGFLWVIDEGKTTTNRLYCNKVDVQDNGNIEDTGISCCIGTGCGISDICTDLLDDELNELPYTLTLWLPDPDAIIARFTETDAARGMAAILDICNALGDRCIGVKADEANEYYYAYSYDGTLNPYDGTDPCPAGATVLADRVRCGGTMVSPYPTYTLLWAKYPDFFEHSRQAKLSNGTYDEVSSLTLLECARRCMATKHCVRFAWSTSFLCQLEALSRRSVGYPPDTAFTVFELKSFESQYASPNGDEKKSQYCWTCPVGRSSLSSGKNAIGQCSRCQPGSISFTGELTPSESRPGLRGQEECTLCPAGMFFSMATASCEQCDLNVQCPSDGLFVGEPCDKHEYSAGSMIDFAPEGQAARASLTCKKCPAGRYNNEPQSSRECLKCPEGFFSAYGGVCSPCPIGTYSQGVGSTQCYDAPPGQFNTWPAATLADLGVCNQDFRCGILGSDRRKCTATDDAFCSGCENLRPGHFTYNTGAECVTKKCPVGRYSSGGCLAELDTAAIAGFSDCCLPCASPCQAGQYSTGCGTIDDTGGMSQNTQCRDCPSGTFTAFSASDHTAQTNYGPGATGCNAVPHEKGLRSGLAPVPLGSAVASVASVGAMECSAKATVCVPCDSTAVVYDVAGVERTRLKWTTRGESGMTHCTSYWAEFGYESMAASTMIVGESDNT